MTICHRVQPQRQLNQMSCWRASVNMVLGYYGVVWESQPGSGMPGDPNWRPAVVRRQFNPESPYTLQTAGTGSDGPQTTGLQDTDFRAMAMHYGLANLSNDQVSAWQTRALETCLTRCGPLWYAVQMPFKHVVVVTGADPRTNRIAVVDPAQGAQMIWSLDEFNGRIVDTRYNPLFYPARRDPTGRPVFGSQVRQTMPFPH